MTPSWLLRCIMGLLFAGAVLSGCSEGRQDGEKGKIEQMTDRVAQEAVDRMQTPIDKARTAKDLHDHRSEDVQTRLDNQ